MSEGGASDACGSGVEKASQATNGAAGDCSGIGYCYSERKSSISSNTYPDLCRRLRCGDGGPQAVCFCTARSPL